MTQLHIAGFSFHHAAGLSKVIVGVLFFFPFFNSCLCHFLGVICILKIINVFHINVLFHWIYLYSIGTAHLPHIHIYISLETINAEKDFMAFLFPSLWCFPSSWPSFEFLCSPETFCASLEMNVSFVLLKAFVFSGSFCVRAGAFSGILLFDFAIFKGFLEFARLILQCSLVKLLSLHCLENRFLVLCPL